MEINNNIKDMIKKSVRMAYKGEDNFHLKLDLHHAGIRFNRDDIEMNGKVVAKIQRRYTQRKVNLCYKELMPKIIWM